MNMTMVLIFMEVQEQTIGVQHHLKQNGTYLTILLGASNVNSKLSSGVANAKWHLGGENSSNYQALTAEGIYTEERNTSAVYHVNPSSIYAKVGLMYPSDYG